MRTRIRKAAYRPIATSFGGSRLSGGRAGLGGPAKPKKPGLSSFMPKKPQVGNAVARRPGGGGAASSGFARPGTASSSSFRPATAAGGRAFAGRGAPRQIGAAPGTANASTPSFVGMGRSRASFGAAGATGARSASPKPAAAAGTGMVAAFKPRSTFKQTRPGGPAGGATSNRRRNVAIGAGAAGTAALGGTAYSAGRRKKVAKSMSSVSAWGVDHGVEISKKWNDEGNRHARRQAGYAALPVVGGVAPLVRAGTKTKKGRKAANVGRTFGRMSAEGMGGAVAGGAIGGALSRGKGTGAQTGSYIGGLGGNVHGAYAAGRNAKKRGDLK